MLKEYQVMLLTTTSIIDYYNCRLDDGYIDQDTDYLYIHNSLGMMNEFTVGACVYAASSMEDVFKWLEENKVSLKGCTVEVKEVFVF